MSTEQRRWFTGGVPDMRGLRAYTEMIQSPDDPERAPRPKGGQADRAPHVTLRKTTAEQWAPKILRLLSDGKPRTLNAIGITLIDKTADITSQTPFAAGLWLLVQQGKVAFGDPAPILFTLSSRVRVEKLAKKGRYRLGDELSEEEEASAAQAELDAPSKARREVQEPKSRAAQSKPKPKPKPKAKAKVAKVARKSARELTPAEAARIVVGDAPKKRRGREGGVCWDPKL